MSPCDYRSFLSVSNFLANDAEIKATVNSFFASKTQGSYIKRWKKVIEKSGDYFVK
ncbi:hypothetical protein WH47_02418 [Habropoda laboriosa]|uniref:Histone-lysine N-methyltransferase SETMAR n=1 Tax=Habropoda laboriosa TaxID=597456 RepID=A0A0L7RKP7_9HYME|nr:hypothetical protein WH47_02418 [Habropoda laboriosa]